MENKSSYIPALKYHWLTGAYDWLIGNFFPEKEIKNALIRQAKISESQAVLDFGCGTATLTLMIKSLHQGVSITGVDVDEKILSVAKTKIEKSGFVINTVKYEGTKLPFEDKCFDRVVTSLVLHHLNPLQKVEALKEMYRVLKPGGELHIADWGKAQNILMRILFFSIQFLDGFETTSDSVAGQLPDHMAAAGFMKPEVSKNFGTMFGTVSLFRANKI